MAKARRFQVKDLEQKGFKADKFGNFKKSPIAVIDIRDTSSNENQKVKNAKKKIIDGISFDSQLEGYMYEELKKYKIPFDLKKKFIIQEAFKYNGETYKAITWTPDFVIGSWIIDTKGFKTKDFKVKFKFAVKLVFSQQADNFEFHFPKNKKEVNDLIIQLIGQRGKLYH